MPRPSFASALATLTKNALPSHRCFTTASRHKALADCIDLGAKLRPDRRKFLLVVVSCSTARCGAPLCHWDSARSRMESVITGARCSRDCRSAGLPDAAETCDQLRFVRSSFRCVPDFLGCVL